MTRPENDVYALDAETGRALWTYHHQNPERTFNCCGKVNRGLAILGNRLFMNTLDMHLIAMDAKSGRELWKVKIHDYDLSGGYAATGALSHSYSPLTNLLYVFARDEQRLFSKNTIRHTPAEEAAERGRDAEAGRGRDRGPAAAGGTVGPPGNMPGAGGRFPPEACGRRCHRDVWIVTLLYRGADRCFCERKSRSLPGEKDTSWQQL